MFERFSAQARETVAQAREQAHLLHHGYIGCEHLLLALSGGRGTPAAGALAAFGLDTAALREGVIGVVGPADAGLDADALASLGIDLDVVRRVTEANFGRGALDRGRHQRGRPCAGGRLPFTPRAKKGAGARAARRDRVGGPRDLDRPPAARGHRAARQCGPASAEGSRSARRGAAPGGSRPDGFGRLSSRPR